MSKLTNSKVERSSVQVSSFHKKSQVQFELFVEKKVEVYLQFEMNLVRSYSNIQFAKFQVHFEKIL